LGLVVAGPLLDASLGTWDAEIGVGVFSGITWLASIWPGLVLQDQAVP
jgi:hypothetical protein